MANVFFQQFWFGRRGFERFWLNHTAVFTLIHLTKMPDVAL